MNFWQFLDRRFNQLPGWPDGRGLIGTAVFALTVMVITIFVFDPSVRQDDFFKTIATAIIITAFINGVVSWAFADTARNKQVVDDITRQREGEDK